MRRIIILLGVFFMGLFSANADVNKNISEFSFDPLMGTEKVALSDYKGKVILIVNTASKCGFTKQYADLETLYQEKKEAGLVILGVPSNDFGAQEPGSESDIADFCRINYGVTFPMTSKTIVSGDDAHPFYGAARQILGFGTAPKWNFHKYLVNKKGDLIDYFHSTTSPASDRLIKAIDKALAE